jgi:hypothetical protein
MRTIALDSNAAFVELAGGWDSHEIVPKLEVSLVV